MAEEEGGGGGYEYYYPWRRDIVTVALSGRHLYFTFVFLSRAFVVDHSPASWAFLNTCKMRNEYDMETSLGEPHLPVTASQFRLHLSRGQCECWWASYYDVVWMLKFTMQMPFWWAPIMTMFHLLLVLLASIDASLDDRFHIRHENILEYIWIRG